VIAEEDGEYYAFDLGKKWLRKEVGGDAEIC
jgi:hypothetical protein